MRLLPKKMSGTLLLGQKSYIWDIIHTVAKSQNFVDFTGAQKSTLENFGTRYIITKYEIDYILEVWGKDCHFKKRYRYMYDNF